MKNLKTVICFIVMAAMLSSGIASAASVSPLDQWTLKNSTSGENGLFGITYGNGTFVVTKAGKGNILTCTPTVNSTWSDCSIPAAYEYIDVEYGNGTFVAAGYGGAILRTTDAAQWTQCVSPTNKILRGIAFGNNTFMVVGDGNTVLTSSNGGVDWNELTTQPNTIGGIYSVAYGNNGFLVIGSIGVAFKADADTDWTVVNGIATGLSEAVYGNGMFVAVGAGGKVVTSPDGITWTSVSSATSELLYSVTYGNNCFAAVGNNQTIITSPNGADWTLRKSGSGSNYYNVTFGENTFVAVGNFDKVVQSGILAGGISGTVKINGDQLLTGAAVALNAGGTTYSTTSDENGDYSFTGIPGGNGYTITASKTGYNTLTVSSISVVPGVITTAADLSMTVFWAQPAPAEPVTPSNISVFSESGVVTATLTVEAKTDSTGKSVVVVTDQQLKDVVNKAIEEAVKAGNIATPEVELKITASTGANEVQINLPENALNDLAGSNISQLKISSSLGVVAFDKKSMQTLAESTTDGIKVTIAKVAPETLNADAQQKIGNRPVYSFSVTNLSGDKTISDFGGSISVALPYAPQPGEDTNAIVIYYINQQGALEIVSNGVYDPATGTVKFSTTHFSIYAVGYNKVSFSDVRENDWYKNAVEFIAARGITAGTGDGKYNPDGKLTRAEFLVMLMKAYGIAPNAAPENNFSDAGSDYDTGYMAEAKKLGISAGVGNNMFAPNKQITRQEMFTLLYNALTVINKLPEGNSDKQLTAYSDADVIESWAKDAITLFVQAEIMSGNENKLNVTTTATRAEMAQVLYKLMHQGDSTHG